MKLGRNALCWCGSGKKYKKCHLNRAESKPKPISEALDVAKRARGSRGCLCPPAMRSECSGDAIGSHTISKSLGLATLADRGHVLGIKYDVGTLNRTRGKGLIGPIGINKMSVFPGFCATHDKALFSPVEDAEFRVTKEQCALLSYRALARERHTKLAGTDVNEFLKTADAGRPLSGQMAIQALTFQFGIGLDLATADLDRALASHHAAVTNHDYGDLESAVFEFPHAFPLLCSTGHMPSDDWAGRVVQDLADPALEADWVTAVSFRSAGRGWVVFTWLARKENRVSDFVDSLRANFPGLEADALIKYFFSVSENIAVSPLWWNGLDSRSRDCLTKRIMDGTPFQPEGVLRPRKGEPVVSTLPLLSYTKI